MRLMEDYDIDAVGMEHSELNDLIVKLTQEKNEISIANVNGTRFIGITFPRLAIRSIKLHLYGTAGNCLANLNEGNSFFVHGNVGDDAGDTMHSGKISVSGDARDVLGQALQGGRIFVQGNAGNRVSVQMREYGKSRPYMVIGGTVDDYLGEYMAGGRTVILNTMKSEIGNYVGSGMIGGRIFIRGRVDPRKIGLQPPERELKSFLKALSMKNLIDSDDFLKLAGKSYAEAMNILTGKAREFGKKLYEEKVGIPDLEYRELDDPEYMELLPVMEEFSSDFNGEYTDLLGDKFTVVFPRNTK